MIIQALPKGNSLERLLQVTGARFYPNLIRAIRKSANAVAKEWITRVQKSTAKEGFKRRYIDAIEIERGETDLSARVFAESMFVNFVEDGIKSYDMKPGLLNSPKAKTSKKGLRYMIVPFRYGAPGAQHLPPMPQKIYDLMRDEKNGTPLSKRIISGKFGKNADKFSIYQGLTRVGRTGHHQFFTFRVVTSKSKGWIFPGIQKVPIFPELKRDVKKIVGDKMKESIIEDLKQEVDRATK